MTLSSRLCISLCSRITAGSGRIASLGTCRHWQWQRQAHVCEILARIPSQTRQTCTRLFSHSAVADLNRNEDIYQELQRLSNEIRRHDEIYYLNGSNTELSDEEYDALVARESALCRDYPQLLKRLERESGLGKQTTRFGGRVGPLLTSTATTTDRFRKRQHLQKMLSLNNALSVDEVLAWLGRIRKTLIKNVPEQDNHNTKVEILTEPKLDGLSLSLRYSRRAPDGPWEFGWAATRGDGKQGQDVTVAVEQGLDIPLSFEWSLQDETCSTIEIRGEVVLPESVFQAFPTENATFSNARNAASGIILRSKQLDDDSEVRKLRKSLRFYAYGVAAKNGDEIFPGGIEVRKEFTSLGFLVPEPTITTVLTIDNEKEWVESDIQPMIDYHASLQLHKQRGGNSNGTPSLSFDDYGMDGCVHKVSSNHLRKILGHTPRAPRWAIAHKFTAETVVTRLLAVDVQVGRTGALTPVARLEPVELNGVLIQRATLHNFGHMQKALGSDRIPVGSSVLVRRAGEVIPQVLRRVESSELNEGNNTDSEMISLQLPDKCPACGSPVTMDEVNRTSNSKVSVGQVLRCAGPPLLCEPRALSALAHAFSRDALDVTGISQARLEKLMSLGFLRTPSDLFLIAKNATLMERLAEEDRWGEKSVQNLVDKVKSVAENGVSLTRFIYSLGIRFVGLQSSALIAAVYGTVDDFVIALKAVIETKDPYEDSFVLLREDNEATKGIGPSVLTALTDFSLEPELVEAAVALSNNIKVHEQITRNRSPDYQATDISNVSGPLAGLKIVFTGSIPDLTRTKAKEMATAMGARSIGNTVSKSTDVVIVGAKGGKKIQEAEKHGIRVIDGDEFLNMVMHFNSSTRDEKKE